MEKVVPPLAIVNLDNVWPASYVLAGIAKPLERLQGHMHSKVHYGPRNPFGVLAGDGSVANSKIHPCEKGKEKVGLVRQTEVQHEYYRSTCSSEQSNVTRLAVGARRS